MLEPHIAPPACVTEDAFAALMEITRRPPVVFVEGRGSWLTDQEGKKYLDFIQGWAVNCLGHCPTAIVSAIKSQAEQLLNCSRPITTGQ
jgi:acetylornithine/N-succinyldiaminopimelate aminotransferase